MYVEKCSSKYSKHHLLAMMVLLLLQKQKSLDWLQKNYGLENWKGCKII